MYILTSSNVRKLNVDLKRRFVKSEIGFYITVHNSGAIVDKIYREIELN